MQKINPFDVFLWTFRKNEKDIVNLYNTLSPVMQFATGGSMLNFGLWSETTKDPISAQNDLCSYFGDMSELANAKTVIDVGSGLSAPALFWQKKFPNSNLYCVNINLNQLKYTNSSNLEFLNSSSTKLPFVTDSVDRVIALESAQHFKPLEDFISESRRVLKKSGLLMIAMPITVNSPSIIDLGILKFTWSSEHYDLDFVRDKICSEGFTIVKEHLIGNEVYIPLADYYLKNRTTLQKTILQNYPKYVESILYRSILKMKESSKKQIIDYVLLKCKV